MDWCLYGDDKRKEMDRDLKPEYLLDDLRRYQDVFGEEFGVKELLMLEDIRSIFFFIRWFGSFPTSHRTLKLI